MPTRLTCCKAAIAFQSDDVVNFSSCLFTHELQWSLRSDQVPLRHRFFGRHPCLQASGFFHSMYLLGVCAEVSTILSVLSFGAISALPFGSSCIRLFQASNMVLASVRVLLRTVARIQTVHAWATLTSIQISLLEQPHRSGCKCTSQNSSARITLKHSVRKQ